MENQGAAEAEKATYDPNAKIVISGVTSNAAWLNNGQGAKIVTSSAQNNWTEIRFENIDTKTRRPPGFSFESLEIRFSFEISATFRGKTVKPAHFPWLMGVCSNPEFRN